MEGTKIWTTQLVGEPRQLLGPKLQPSELMEGHLWPYPPEWIVRFASEDSRYVVDVEVALEKDVPYVTGIAVRVGLPTSPTGSREDPWLEGEYYDPLIVRDVQRMHLPTYAKAALAKVRDPFTQRGREEVRQIVAPRRRRERGLGSEHYDEVLRVGKELEANGERPVPEIQRRWNVSANVAYQWLHRARRNEAQLQAARADSADAIEEDDGSRRHDASE